MAGQGAGRSKAGQRGQRLSQPKNKRNGRSRMTSAERREQLIEIARTLFAERGFEGTSIEEVASRAEVSKPIVYEHFGGKEGLYAVVVDREVRQLLDMMRSALTAGHPRPAGAGRPRPARLHRAVLRRLPHPGARLALGSESGSFVSIIGDVASRWSTSSKRSSATAASTRSTRRCTRRCSSAWSAPPASGGWRLAPPARTKSARTWSTSPGTDCLASTRTPSSAPAPSARRRVDLQAVAASGRRQRTMLVRRCGARSAILAPRRQDPAVRPRRRTPGSGCPNIGGSSELTVTTTPAACIALTGWSRGSARRRSPRSTSGRPRARCRR